jgi:hypothetical protein
VSTTGAIVGFRFSHTVDVTAVATAIAALATVGLAITTAILARGTRRAAIATEHEAAITREQSQATVRQAEATAMMVELTKLEATDGRRPVIVPQVVGDEGHGPGMVAHGGLIPVPLKNVGLGPALNVSATFKSPSDIAPQLISSEGDFARLPAIGIGELATVGLKTQLALGPLDFVIELTYDDLAQQKYFTSARWDSHDAEYRAIVTRPINTATTDD